MAGQKKKRGERGWSDEQRAAQSERMKAMHKKQRLAAAELELPDKEDGIENLTLGQLINMLEELVKGGAKKGTPVVFLHGCEERPMLCYEKKFDENGNLVDVVFVR
jgi:hypothetical protein